MSFTLLMAVTAAIAAGAGYFAAKKGPKDKKQDLLGKNRDKEKEKDKDREDKKKDDLGANGKKRGPDLDDVVSAAKGKNKNKPKPKTSIFDALPLALGDVVTGDGEERWLAGALVLREDTKVVACVFLAPEGSTLHAVVAFARPRRDIYWLKPSEISSPDEPPATIEIGGVALRRKGRIPVSVERVGQGAPQLGETAVFGTYDGGGREVAVVLTSDGKAYGWVGSKLDEGDYDRLGGGGEET